MISSGVGSSTSAAIPTPPELVGETCRLCLVELSADTHVVLCPACAAPRHLEGEEVAETDRLACAELGSCPVCETPLPAASDGYAFLPEGSDVEVSQRR